MTSFTALLASVLAFLPSVIATVVFIVRASRYFSSKKNAKSDGTGDDTLPQLKKSMRNAGVAALTFWVLLGVCYLLFIVAVYVMIQRI